MRLQKYLACRGLCSRREAERLIQQGHVLVDGRVAQLGEVVGEGAQVVFKGQVVSSKIDSHLQDTVVMLHKPRGYLVSRKSQGGKRTIYDLPSLKAFHQKHFPQGGFLPAVGRLDYDSEGLLLLTRNGELSQRLTHPRYGCLKVYVVGVSSEVSASGLKHLRSGVTLEEGPVRGCEVRKVSLGEEFPWIQGNSFCYWYVMGVSEGRKHLVRRLFRFVGAEVQRLIRWQIGEYVLPEGLGVGELREVKVRIPEKPRSFAH